MAVFTFKPHTDAGLIDGWPTKIIAGFIELEYIDRIEPTEADKRFSATYRDGFGEDYVAYAVGDRLYEADIRED